MGDFNISNRYATALLELAEEKKSLDVIAGDIELIKNTLIANKQLQLMLHNPVIKVDKKLQILTEIFKSKVSADSFNFIAFVLNKDRHELLLPIVKRFLELRDETKGIVEAKVSGSVEFTPEQKNKLQNQLEKTVNKKVRISFSVNKDLIGGFVIRMNDTVFDASVKHQLELLKENFLKGNIQQN